MTCSPLAIASRFFVTSALRSASLTSGQTGGAARRESRKLPESSGNGRKERSYGEYRAELTWEALTAVSSLFQALLLLVAGGAAIYQLLEVRRASQFEATRTMVDRMLDPSFTTALMYVIDELPQRITDPTYREELTSSRGWDLAAAHHPELIVLARLEEMGIYVRNRLLLSSTLLDFGAELILESWERLVEVVALMRSSQRNPNVWENAQFLYHYTKDRRPAAEDLVSKREAK